MFIFNTVKRIINSKGLICNLICKEQIKINIFVNYKILLYTHFVFFEMKEFKFITRYRTKLLLYLLEV